MQETINKIVIASNNKGKIKELSSILSPFNIEVIPQSKFNIKDVEETGSTFVENAILKAKNAAKISGLPSLGDDSGLIVPALRGAPGIYSARYALDDNNIKTNDNKNNKKLLKELNNIIDRQASFNCVMALCLSATHPLPIIAQGVWHGEIVNQLRGTKGFGYDPLFYIPSHNLTAAELSSAEKNKISHRGLALQELISKLNIKKQTNSI